MWLRGSKGTTTLSDRRTLRAQDPGLEYGAPTAGGAEEENELCSKGHSNEAHELNRSEGALFSARREEDDLKLRELMQAKERAPPIPTPPNGSNKASSPDSVLFLPESPPLPSLPGAAFKTTKTRRTSSGPRKTHDHPLFSAGVSFPFAEPLSPERHSRFYTRPSRGNN